MLTTLKTYVDEQIQAVMEPLMGDISRALEQLRDEYTAGYNYIYGRLDQRDMEAEVAPEKSKVRGKPKPTKRTNG